MRQNEPLKIGLLVESEMASFHIYELVQWAQRQSNLTISHLIVLKPHKPHRTLLYRFSSYLRLRSGLILLRRRLFGLITSFEAMRLKKSTDFRHLSQRYDLRTIIPIPIYVEPEIADDNDSAYHYSSSDILAVKSSHVDLIIAMESSKLLPDDILSSCKLGVISFLYWENLRSPCGPLAFWEVYQRQDATEFVIKHLNTHQDQRILVGGRFPTKHFYLLNQAALYKKELYYLQDLLAKIATNKAVPYSMTTTLQSEQLYRMPHVTQQLLYLSRQITSAVTKFLTRFCLKREERWNVAFAKSDWKTLVLEKANKIANPPNHFLADPFVVSERGRDFCFVEDYDYLSRRACIAVYELQDKKVRRLGNAIVESFHLSFPYMFRHKGKLYMCPETCERKDIRLYECIDFPLGWKLSTIIMDNVVAVDSMIFEHNGLWWLFTNIDPVKEIDCCTELYIFCSEDPTSTNWMPHAKNPVLINSFKARNGGLLSHHGALYRVGQHQGFDQYGKSFSINKIEVLTRQDYLEVTSDRVEPNFFNNISGTHHMHSNNSITVFDYVKLEKVSR